mgnify:CR=1 FL=1
MIIYPSSDVYTHNYNNSILFGRKNPPKKGQAWLYLPNDSKFLRLEICIKISQMRDARKAIMPHVQLDDEDINIIKTKIIFEPTSLYAPFIKYLQKLVIIFLLYRAIL